MVAGTFVVLKKSLVKTRPLFSNLLFFAPSNNNIFHQRIIYSKKPVPRNQGVNGLYTNGTAGEFHTQTEAEFDQIHELVAARCTAANLPFQIGANHMSFQLSLERIRRAHAFQPSAFQVILPDWFPLQEAEMLTCLPA